MLVMKEKTTAVRKKRTAQNAVAVPQAANPPTVGGAVLPPRALSPYWVAAPVLESPTQAEPPKPPLKQDSAPAASTLREDPAVQALKARRGFIPTQMSTFLSVKGQIGFTG